MNDFTQDELTLMSIYNGSGTRQGLIDEMTAMRAYLDADEAELRTLTDSAIKKLGAITDKEYAALELIPDFEE
ncbi:MAG: transposon-transfer assisting family protein [Oscillospiraceae bacterium]|jgi:ABC-type enterochelin transport system substrate-binding protein|nr:transposon-transfer assisting family protein [Oscillospiraceae bacterium]